MFVKFQLRPIWRPVLIFLFIMSFYQVLVSGGVLPASDGASLIQNNIVKAQRYVYQDDSDLRMVIVGSSLAANLNEKQIGEGVKSIALGGGASQTGLYSLRNCARSRRQNSLWRLWRTAFVRLFSPYLERA